MEPRPSKRDGVKMRPLCESGAEKLRGERDSLPLGEPVVIIVINRAPIIPSNGARAATLAIFVNRAPILGAVSSIYHLWGSGSSSGSDSGSCSCSDSGSCSCSFPWGSRCILTHWPIGSPLVMGYLSPAGFSHQVLGFSSSLWMEVAKSCAAARAEKLQDGIRLLEKQLRSEVIFRHHDLLSQLSSLKDADSALRFVRIQPTIHPPSTASTLRFSRDTV
ncbi:hypothetical protein F0562_020267 [Nyssa sinensis]|uniref:Uncharacterized protein n=1 Tax=Nyssa sinensis TaxID=561372 RepID=A0A5J5BQN7_9ASTE|nr:hypothetical protein F0562_020267 [Nyssa sinensis]